MNKSDWFITDLSNSELLTAYKKDRKKYHFLSELFAGLCILSFFGGICSICIAIISWNIWILLGALLIPAISILNEKQKKYYKKEIECIEVIHHIERLEEKALEASCHHHWDFMEKVEDRME